MAETTLPVQEPPDLDEAPFAVAVSGNLSRGTHCLKANNTFLVVDNHGDIGACPGSHDGLYVGDTRYLSGMELLIDAKPPLRLGSSVDFDNVDLHCDLTNQDLYRDGVLTLPKDTLHIARTVFISDLGMHVRLALTNHGEHDISAVASIDVDCDFADIFEARGARRPARGRIERGVTAPHEVMFTYVGLDRCSRQTRIAFEPAPQMLTASSAQFSVRLAPQQASTIFLSVRCDEECTIARPALAFLRRLRSAGRRQRRRLRNVATIETDNPAMNEVFARSRSDLYMLTTDFPEGAYPYAGLPWFATTFGRDGLITAMSMLAYDPELAKGVLRRLASRQATVLDEASDSSPGKILHEMRTGEMAALGEVPFGLYYGSVDATPLFVLLAGMAFERTGDVAFAREIWPAVERALAWIDDFGDPQNCGFVTYPGSSAQGLSNQCWKDSVDSIFHADGTRAAGPIASVEVQAYVFAAKMHASRLVRALGDDVRSQALAREAESLRDRFERAFWCEDIGTYALALDGDGSPCRVRSSNAGHALFCGIASAERARRVAAQLVSPAFHSGWGVRTVAATEVRYNPMSYHNGSIWPHDNALIAAGCARYGETEAAEAIFTSMMTAAEHMTESRLPELFCGFKRRRARGPTRYPVACSPQAWASAAPFLLLSSLIGLRLDTGQRRVSVAAQRFPTSLGSLTIRNLAIADGRADVRIAANSDGCARIEVLNADCDVQADVD